MDEDTNVEVTDEGQTQGFAAAFSDDAEHPRTETPGEPSTPAAQPEEPPEPKPVKYAQITEDEYQSLLARAAQIDEIKAETGKKIDTAFGKLGEINRVIAQLQQSGQAGAPLSLTDEDLAELHKEFPEIAAMTAKGLNRVLGRLGGGAPNVDALVQEKLAPALESVPQTVKALVSEELLQEKHGDWRAIVGAPEDSTNAFRQWLSQQPKERQSELNSTYDHRVISKAITDFNEARKKAEAADQRKSRLAAAVTPRSAPGNAQPLDDDESAGFKAAFADG